MQRITIGKNGKLSEPALFKKNAVSDWEKWNEERDRRITEIFTEEKE